MQPPFQNFRVLSMGKIHSSTRVCDPEVVFTTAKPHDPLLYDINQAKTKIRRITEHLSNDGNSEGNHQQGLHYREGICSLVAQVLSF